MSVLGIVKKGRDGECWGDIVILYGIIKEGFVEKVRLIKYRGFGVFEVSEVVTKREGESVGDEVIEVRDGEGI